MQYGDVKALFSKIDRYYERKEAFKGLTAEEELRLPINDGMLENPQVLSFTIPQEQISDLAIDLAKTVWDCKDWIVKKAVLQGITRKTVDSEINTMRELCIIADLANGLKHAGLGTPPRSGINGIHINGTAYSAQPIPGKAETPIINTGHELIMRFAVTGFNVTATIRDEAENEIGELFATCKRAIEQWEEIISRLGIHI